MGRAEELLEATASMDAAALLRCLIAERFPGRTVVTVSLRGRSVVVLKLISEIDPATPVVFCHVPELFPESVEYRAGLIRTLGLRDVREPLDDAGPLADDASHVEGLWAENPADHSRAYKTIGLNRTLADFDCWISAVYHNPYPETPGPRLRAEGRLIRVDPLADWSQDRVRGFMADCGLSYHPQAMLRRPRPAAADARSVPSYHY